LYSGYRILIVAIPLLPTILSRSIGLRLVAAQKLGVCRPGDLRSCHLAGPSIPDNCRRRSCTRDELEMEQPPTCNCSTGNMPTAMHRITISKASNRINIISKTQKLPNTRKFICAYQSDAWLLSRYGSFSAGHLMLAAIYSTRVPCLSLSLMHTRSVRCFDRRPCEIAQLHYTTLHYITLHG
jgi:hypothetical protein